MGTTYKVTHCFQMQGGTTQDMVCNQFYFFSVSKAPDTVEAWGPVLANYVHQLFVLGNPSISRFYNNRCAGNGGVTKIYDAGTSGPGPYGSPIYVISDTALVPADEYLADIVTDAVSLPEEVALCLSYSAIHVGGDLPRRRGRIYLGPFNRLALEDSFTTPSRPSAVLISAMLEGAVLMQEGAASFDMEWRVFSPSDGFAFKIVDFQVDDAFDTIRGRGTAPAFRQHAPIS